MKTQIIKVKIGGHLWSVRFMEPHLMRPDENGTCWTNKCCIDIDCTMDEKETKLILTHEIVHALLGTQGRAFQKEYDEESICEIITWNIDEIIAIRNKVLEARK